MRASVAQSSTVAHVLPSSLCRKELAAAALQARGADAHQVPGLGWA